jgi:chromosome segregation ATPase
MTTDLDQRVTRLEADMEATQASLRQMAESQVRSDERLNSFIYEVQRLLSNQGGRLERIEAAIETLVATAQRHDRDQAADRAEFQQREREREEDRADFQAFRSEMRGLTERLDNLVHYLLRQQG